MSHQCEQSNKSAVSDYKPLLIVSSQPYPTLLYGWVCFRHAIGQFAVRNLLYGPKFLKKMLISEL